jgi:aminoglycoside 2''-phosphotransferase
VRTPALSLLLSSFARFETTNRQQLEDKAMLTKQEMLEIIRRDCPHLEVSSVTFIEKGQSFYVIEINSHLIFRFPLEKKSRRKLQREILLLPKLESLLNLPIPHFNHIGKTSKEPADYYVSYEAIKGSPLRTETFQTLPQEVQDNFARQLAVFLVKLHSFPVCEAQRCAVQESDLRQHSLEDLQFLQRRIFGELPLATRRRIEQLFEGYINDEENFSNEPSLLHADLCEEHIYFEPGRNTITGIIDFGSMHIGDPDFDLCYLLQDYGEGFINLLLQYYPHADYIRLISKLAFFRRRKKIMRLCQDKSSLIAFVDAL